MTKKSSNHQLATYMVLFTDVDGLTQYKVVNEKSPVGAFKKATKNEPMALDVEVYTVQKCELDI